MRAGRSSVVLAGVLVLAAAAAPAPAAARPVITLAASVPMTGSLAAEGALIADGYRFCRDTINAAGGLRVGGTWYRVALKLRDDASVAANAAAFVRAFHRQGNDLVLGSYGSSASQAQADVVADTHQVLAISSGAADSIYDDGNRWIFGVLSPASEYMASMLDALVEQADPVPETVAFLSADDPFSTIATQAGVSEAGALGMTVTTVQVFPAFSTDVDAALLAAEATDPDLILASVHLVEGEAIISRAQALGVDPSGGWGQTVAPVVPGFAADLGTAAEYVLSSTQWTPQTMGHDPVFGTARSYARAFRAAYGYEPVYQNAQATAACLALTRAIQRAGGTDPVAVRDRLAALDMRSFFGRIAFDHVDFPGMNVTKPMAVIQIQDGEPVTVWPPGPGTGELWWPTPPFDQR
jgi:branched-chain amino acid transport system substrate-binding protein